MANRYDPKNDPSSWQHDKQAHPGGPTAGTPGGKGIPLRGPMSLEQHQWLHPKTGNADFAAQEAQAARQERQAANAKAVSKGAIVTPKDIVVTNDGVDGPARGRLANSRYVGGKPVAD